jgi:threonine 3-dehydrogenase
MKIIGVNVPGAFADYIAVPESCLWLLDDAIDYETGALLEPMGVGVHGVLSGEVANRSVLILGCGPIGLFAVATAAACGASKLFAVDIVDEKLQWAKKFGADYIYNSVTPDYIDRILEKTDGAGVDVIIDYTGHTGLIAQAFQALKKGGRFTFVGLANNPLTLEINDNIIYKEARINGVTGRLMYKTWQDCANLILNHKLNPKEMIGGTYPMQSFDAAFAALKAGKPGKMLLIP